MISNHPYLMAQVARYKIDDDIRRAEAAALAREVRRTTVRHPRTPRFHDAGRALAHHLTAWSAHLHVRVHRAHP